MRVIFRHYKNVGKTRLRRFINDAYADCQIELYGRVCTPFRDILQTDHVTVCTYLDEEEQPIARGFAFCRGDLFLKEKGRWYSENRVRKELELPLIPDPFVARQEAREGAAALRHTKNRELGLERQETARRAREATSEAAD